MEKRDYRLLKFVMEKLFFFFINLIYMQMHLLFHPRLVPAPYKVKTNCLSLDAKKKKYVQFLRQAQTKRKLFNDTYCYYINIMYFKLNYDNFFFSRSHRCTF